MDGTRFDDLSRSLATGLSRRAAMKGTVAGFLAALGLRKLAAAGPQAQCGNVICAADPGICNENCVCCVYSNGNSRCRPPGQCTGSGTITCPAGQQYCANLGRCDECCVGDDPVCNDLVACTSNACVLGICVTTPDHTLCPPGFICDPVVGCTCPPFQRLSEGECVDPCSIGDCIGECDHCAARVDGTAQCFNVGGCLEQTCTSDSECEFGFTCIQSEFHCGDQLGHCGNPQCV